MQYSYLLCCVLLASAQAAQFIVAIYGGGTAGATLAQGLKDCDHIEVQYYEPGEELFPEQVRDLGLAANSLNALELLGPEAKGVIERCPSVVEHPTIVFAGDGTHAGDVLLDTLKLPNTTHRPDTTVVDSPSFQRQMLNGTSPSRLHTNKTIISVGKELDSRRMTLHFEDGSSATTDVLIGDDGPQGFLRQHILGKDDPSIYPTFANFLSTFAVVSYSEGQKQLGHEYISDRHPRRSELIGNGSWWLTEEVEDTVACVATFYTTENYNVSRPIRLTTREELEGHFGGFAIGKGIVNILSNQSLIFLLPEVEYLDVPMYVRGMVAMTGDAAHPMTNFQEHSFGMAIEDAMILAVLLRATADASVLPAALETYDEIRRPRTQEVARSAKQLGLLWTGRAPGVGTDVTELRKALLRARNSVAEFDLVGHRDDALRMLAAKQGRSDDEMQTAPVPMVQSPLLS